jgi:hypothetical protein
MIRKIASIKPSWQAIKEWIPDDEPDFGLFSDPRNPSETDPGWFDKSSTRKAPKFPIKDGRILLLRSN